MNFLLVNDSRERVVEHAVTCRSSLSELAGTGSKRTGWMLRAVDGCRSGEVTAQEAEDCDDDDDAEHTEHDILSLPRVRPRVPVVDPHRARPAVAVVVVFFAVLSVLGRHALGVDDDRHCRLLLPPSNSSTMSSLARYHGISPATSLVVDTDNN